MLCTSRKDGFFHLVVGFAVGRVGGLQQVSDLRGDGNHLINHIHPQTLPPDIVTIRPDEIFELVGHYQNHPARMFNDSKINQIFEQHRHLPRVDQRRVNLKAAMSNLF